MKPDFLVFSNCVIDLNKVRHVNFVDGKALVIFSSKDGVTLHGDDAKQLAQRLGATLPPPEPPQEFAVVTRW